MMYFLKLNEKGTVLYRVRKEEEKTMCKKCLQPGVFLGVMGSNRIGSEELSAITVSKKELDF